MPPRLPQGMRYAPRDPAPAPRTTDRPESLLPEAPFPQASGTSLDPLPSAFYPGAGPTEFGWTYQELQKLPFPGTPNTWTALQTYTGSTGPLTQHTLTDAATGADVPGLRPTMRQTDHLTTATPVPGIGGSDTFRAQDSNGTVVEITKIAHEITNVTPGLVDATIAFCVMHQGQMCETMRVRGQLGQDATADSNAVYGFLGGQCWVRTDFLVTGKAGFYGTVPVSQPATASAAGIAAIRTDTIAHAIADIQAVLTALRAWPVTMGLTANTT